MLRAGGAVLSHNTVESSVKPGIFTLRPIRQPALRTQISMASRAQRPATLPLKAAQDLIRATLAAVARPAG